MWLRYLSAFFALAFGLLLSFVIFDQGIYLGFRFDWRTLLAIIAIISAIAVFARQSVLFVIFSMALQVATYFQVTIGIIGAMVLGSWSYSKLDMWTLPLTILPVLSLAAALLALATQLLNDTSIQRALRFLRSWPDQESS
jgi:hypothetical protein